MGRYQETSKVKIQRGLFESGPTPRAAFLWNGHAGKNAWRTEKHFDQIEKKERGRPTEGGRAERFKRIYVGGR